MEVHCAVALYEVLGFRSQQKYETSSCPDDILPTFGQLWLKHAPTHLIKKCAMTLNKDSLSRFKVIAEIKIFKFTVFGFL